MESLTTSLPPPYSIAIESTPTATSLSPEQKQAFLAYRSGKNVFVTSGGGCGKTFLLRHIVDDARKRNLTVAVCALTGKAAVLLGRGARTIHSWAGIGLAKGTKNEITKKVSKKGQSAWKKVDLLLIDEVSMMSRHLFDVLNHIAQTFRFMLPFGGIQVVFSGDFCQLPPIADGNCVESGEYCFQSPDWDTVFPIQIELLTNFRQKDPEFIALLNRIRVGDHTENDIEFLHSLTLKTCDDEFMPTFISPIKRQVTTINETELNGIKTEMKKFIYSEKAPSIIPNGFTKADIKKEIDMLYRSVPMEPTLLLKRGAQVMCTANLDVEGGICNGSQGVVVDFRHGCPVVEFLNGQMLKIEKYTWSSELIPGVSISQIPLILSWAQTSHKVQGSTLESAEINGGRDIFERGQFYVSLSRVKSSKKLYLSEFDPSSIMVDEIVVDFYRRLRERSD